MFPKTIVTVMMFIEREKIGYSDGLIDICFGEGENNLLGHSGTRTNYK
jgi:hypothetical protein